MTFNYRTPCFSDAIVSHKEAPNTNLSLPWVGDWRPPLAAAGGVTGPCIIISVQLQSFSKPFVETVCFIINLEA